MEHRDPLTRPASSRRLRSIVVCAFGCMVALATSRTASASAPPPASAGSPDPTDLATSSEPPAEGGEPPLESGEPSAEPGATSPESSEPPPAFDPQPPRACVPSCREGFVCADGACVSACNPPCAIGHVCTDAAQCVIPERTDGESPREATKKRGRGDDRDRKGLSLGYGLEFDYTRVLHRAFTPDTPFEEGDEYVAHGPLISLGQVFLFDYGFTDRVFLGGRLGLGGFVNSDRSSGTGLRVQFGPSFTAFPARNFYIGTDFLFEYLSFDDIKPKFGGADDFDGEAARDVGEIDGAALLGFSWVLRFGGTIPLPAGYALVPELRLHGNAVYFEKIEAEVERPDEFGSCCTVDPADKVYTPGIGLFFGFRRFF